MMMETQDINYIPSDVKIAAADVSRDQDNPVGYLIVNDKEEPIYKEKTTIGRDTTADIVINAQQISRLHATVKANLAESTIFVCVYGKNNYLKLLEMEPELFYQVADGDTIDFRSIKVTYKENKQPDNEDSLNDESTENGKHSEKVTEENGVGVGDEKEVEKVVEANKTGDEKEKVDKEDEIADEGDEEQCTQFEFDSPAKDDKEDNADKSLSSPASNPFLDESDMTPPKPRDSGFRLQRLPSFETQEQEIAELETQPVDEPIGPPPEPKTTALESKLDETQASTLGLCVSLDNETTTVLDDDTNTVGDNETPTILESTPDRMQTQTQSQVEDLPQSLCEVRKALFDDNSEDSLQIIEIEGKDCQPKMAVKEEKVEEEPSSQTLPEVTKQTDPVETPEKPASPAAVEEATILEESSDCIVEGSDDEGAQFHPKARLLVMDTQDQTLDDSRQSVDAGVIAESDAEDQEVVEETQVEDSNAFEASDNVTAVEVLPKEQSDDPAEEEKEEKTINEVPIPEEASKETEIPQEESTEKAQQKPAVVESPEKEEETVVEASPDEKVASSAKSAARKKRLSVSPVKRATRVSKVSRKIEVEREEDESKLPEKEAPDSLAEPGTEEAKPEDVPDGKEPEAPSAGPAVVTEDATPPVKRGRRSKKVPQSSKPEVEKAREKSPVLDISIAEEVKMSPRAAKVVAEEKLPRGRRKKAEPKEEVEAVEQKATRVSTRRGKAAPADDSKAKAIEPSPEEVVPKRGGRRKVAKAPSEQEKKESETEEGKGRAGRKRVGKAAAESEPPVKSPKKSPRGRVAPPELTKKATPAVKVEEPTVRTRSGRVSVRKKFESDDEEEVPKSTKLRKTAPVVEPKVEVKTEAKEIKVPRGRSTAKKAVAVKEEISTSVTPAGRATRKGRTSSSVTSSGDSQSRTRTKYCVFFSGFEGPATAEKEIVAKLGGQTKDEVPDIRHKGEEFILVVNGTLKRTLKVLDFIGFGAPIVSQQWLKACQKANCFVDAWSYILKDKAAEKKFGFDLKECLLKASKERNVFKGWNVFFTPNVTPKGQCLKNCVVGLGGKYLPTKLKKWPDNLMVVSCDGDKDVYEGIKKDSKKLKNVLVVTVQGFFECLQQQKIVCLEQFSL